MTSAGSVASQQSPPVPGAPELDGDEDHHNVSTPHMRGGKGEARSGSKAKSSAAPQQQHPTSRSRHRSQRTGGESTTIPSSVAAAAGGAVGGSSADSRHQPSYSSPRTPRPTKRQPQPPPIPPPVTTPSFTDQIAQSAVSTTMELLKLATGVTLSTTGKLYAPSLQVTRTVLLPSIFAALVEYLGAVTPQRGQDWFRILSSSAYHITTVLTQEAETGQQFRRALQLFWSSLVESASSPTTIQALVDGVTCWVRLADAAHTPEFRAFLDQLGLAMCRIFDAAAAGTTHQLAHNAAELAWATAELLSDPRTTCAVAEVTAYLCHALEMEHVHHRDPHRSSSDPARDAHSRNDHEGKETSGSSGRYRPWARCERSRKRRARDQQQKSTYQSSILLPHSQPPATVEEVILSSLGCEPTIHDDLSYDDDETSHDDNDDASIPSKVVCTTVKEKGNVKDDADVSSRHHDDDGDSRGDDGSMGEQSRQPFSTKREWYQRVKEGVRNDVNVDILQQSIMGRAKEDRNRARSIPVEPSRWTGGSANVEDVADFMTEGGVSEAPPRSAKRKRLQVEVRTEENGDAENNDDANRFLDEEPWPHSQRPERYDGETPVEHFYRVLDEVLALQQGNALQRLVEESGGRKRLPGSPRGRVSKPTPSLRDRVAELRAGFENVTKEKQRKEQRAARRLGVVVYALLAGLFMTILVFAGFAAYGAYALLSPMTRTVLGKADSSAQYPGGTSELVVRVVREVVHVDREGKVLRSTNDGPVLAADRVDRVTNCLASEL